MQKWDSEVGSAEWLREAEERRRRSSMRRAAVRIIIRAHVVNPIRRWFVRHEPLLFWLAVATGATLGTFVAVWLAAAAVESGWLQ